ncbi:hypothetical protein SCLCIDRAFT_211202 [Scleroderma citrinum Foug A]|uniref:Uncharacterized protein n=1 Tax=Scleroderma citrinum Foug A TaxID=1036808 RepID=A0A0C2Z452_9AGAM|nr:hypothetical protein SCLCIDRAFT_211202 [Scleroderma citrinum Foug A]
MSGLQRKSEDLDHLSTANSISRPSKLRKRSPTQLLNTSSTPLAQQPNSSGIHALPSNGSAKNVDSSSVATEPDNKEDELSKETDKSKKLTHVGVPAKVKSLVGGLGLQRVVISLLFFPLIRLPISFRPAIVQIRGS